jgi:hypothetical protein|tara:strand:+ start:868 stop:1167 length:300 start_codon:yes stop_codon:yes gene_type:complete
MIVLSVLLSISLLVNGILIWYCRRMTQQFVFFSDNVSDLEGSLEAFSSHLNGVHELETFYGDETLGGLIEHSRSVVENIKGFYDGFSLEESPEEEDGES